MLHVFTLSLFYHTDQLLLAIVSDAPLLRFFTGGAATKCSDPQDAARQYVYGNTLRDKHL